MSLLSFFRKRKPPGVVTIPDLQTNTALRQAITQVIADTYGATIWVRAITSFGSTGYAVICRIGSGSDVLVIVRQGDHSSLEVAEAAPLSDNLDVPPMIAKAIKVWWPSASLQVRAVAQVTPTTYAVVCVERGRYEDYSEHLLTVANEDGLFCVRTECNTILSFRHRYLLITG